MFLIDDAMAQDAAAGAESWSIIFMIGIFFLFLYFLVIRPQNKRVKEHQALVAGVQKGDEVVTSGGLMGRVAKLGETTVRLEVADGMELQLRKDSISSVLPKGSLSKSD